METKENCNISVIMPAYNAEKYIKTAILSVINQTLTDWELIVIDDCSTDNTAAIVKEMALKDNRIKYYKNDANIGVAETRNRGFELSRGTYVALLDSDDLWLKEKLHQQVELLEQTKSDIVYCSYSIIDESGNKKCSDFVVPQEATYETSLIKSVISCSTVLMTRRIVEKYKFTNKFYHEDLVLWLQLLKDGYIARGVVDVLAEYRTLSGTRSSNKLKSLINKFKVYRSFLKLSFWNSMVLIVKSASTGLRKYKRIGR